jgi:hypothetical protein
MSGKSVSFAFEFKGKSALTLSRRTWSTLAVIGVAVIGIIVRAILIIIESFNVRKGTGRVYSRKGQLRLQVIYDHLPHNAYDVPCPDDKVAVGSEVTVWAYGTELWNVRTVGDAPKFESGEPASITAPIILIVVAVLLSIWYFGGMKK